MGKGELFDLAGSGLAPFDLVLVLGGALNYSPDEMEAALRLLRGLLKPGGRIVGSAMSTVGALAQSLGVGWLPEPEITGEELLAVYRSGMLTDRFSEHRAKMLHAEELRAVLERSGLQALDLSATNCLLSLPQVQIEALAARPEVYSALLEAEFDACRRNPDAGGHILFAAAGA